MNCPNCAHENRAEARFCSECGQKLEQVCPKCNQTVGLAAKFCDSCGTLLELGSAAGDAVPTAVAEIDGASDSRNAHAERRQLTVMFCDMVGSTSLSERLDPEDLRDLLAAYQSCCTNVVDEFDGHVARYVGDGILVYFGYPRAHEDDARRCLQAALRILDEVPRVGLGITHADIKPQVRIGIATGLVVAGDIGSGERHEEMGVVGETPNIAARLQSLAEPGSIVVSASTERLVDGLFELHDLGPQQLRGISESIKAYRVLAESDIPSHFEARASRGLTPLVGREEEVGLLARRWQNAKEGEASVVLLMSEAGVGKSRIVRAFNERLGDDPRSRVLYFCSPYHANSAFYPLIDQVQRAFRFEKQDTLETKLDRLDSVLSDLQLSPRKLGPILAKLLSLPCESRYGTSTYTPQQFKRKVFELCYDILQAMCKQNPVLMVVEDAHWADPSTLELLEFLSEQLRWHRFLLIVTGRPEFEPQLGNHDHAAILRLSRLSRRESAAIVTQMLGERPMPAELVTNILEKTDGVPLYVEELTRVLLDSTVLQGDAAMLSATGQLATLDIPASLQDSLMARLDSLTPEAKEVAQLAATIGRNFNHELVVAVSPLSVPNTESALEELVTSELVFRRDLPPLATYEFKHALLRDTAYESLLRRVRQSYHLLITEALERIFPELTDTEPELLAHHYTEAGEFQEARKHWALAGQRAVQRSANLEAIHHYEKALELSSQYFESRERLDHELELLVSLGVPLIAARGWAAPEVARNYQKASSLCEQVGDTPLRFPALKGAFGFHLMRGELQRATEFGNRLLEWATKSEDSAQLLEARMALGMASFWTGDFQVARTHLDDAGGLYDPATHESHAYRFGTEPGVAQLFYSARNLWHLGYFDQALARSERALALARERQHPHSLAWAMAFAAALRLFRREWPATLAHAEETIDLCGEYGFPFWMAWGTILRGWVWVAEGRGGEGLAEIRQGLAAYRSTGAEVARPYFLTLLAEALGSVGQTEEGLTALKEAHLLARNSQNRCSEAEMHRLRGSLLLNANGTHSEEAKASFNKAIHVARKQGAKSFELRASIDLAHLLRKEGMGQEAVELMVPLCDWFQEGETTADIEDANRILRELN